ncbi:MAG: (2Fe-2S) ferredoxin domain-containing protein [Deltaproteobacteria bacterium]|nr:(2Fe-2S) ferredoxin domain-containing protein [Deltaproteobacteria bacterium]
MKKNITICLGSSCFARGNHANLEIIERCLADGTLPPDMVELRGSCCEQLCSDGPNISIDGRMLHSVDAGMLAAVLEEIARPPQDTGTDPPGAGDAAYE